MDNFSLGSCLEAQSGATLNRLYEHPLTCMAVFRLLPELAKHYVMRLLCLQHSLSLSIIAQWVSKEKEAQIRHKEAIEKLKRLRLFQVDSQGNIMLHPTFKEGLQTALAGKKALLTPQPEGQMVETSGKGGKEKLIADLDSYTRIRWEELLHFMAGYRTTKFTTGIDVLEFADLMQKRSKGGYEITSKGWQFLLLDTTSQAWHLMLKFLMYRSLSKKQREQQVSSKTNQYCDIDEEALSFIFQLCFSTLGQAYPVDALTTTQLEMLRDLRAFGLIKMKSGKDPVYYPTRLAVNMAGGLTLTHGTERRSYLVVETNLRVYAYTDNTLEIAMVGNFCKLLYRFPGVIVGLICRESIRDALMKGIKAEQICNFLRIHAHPQMKTQKPIIPPNVTHQIHLWEAERNRLIFTEGCLYEGFSSQQEFDVFLKKAQEFGALLWHSVPKKRMVITLKGHKMIKEFREKERGRREEDRKKQEQTA